MREIFGLFFLCLTIALILFLLKNIGGTRMITGLIWKRKTTRWHVGGCECCATEATAHLGNDTV